MDAWIGTTPAGDRDIFVVGGDDVAKLDANGSIENEAIPDANATWYDVVACPMGDPLVAGEWGPNLDPITAEIDQMSLSEDWKQVFARKAPAFGIALSGEYIYACGTVLYQGSVDGPPNVRRTTPVRTRWRATTTHSPCSSKRSLP